MKIFLKLIRKDFDFYIRDNKKVKILLAPDFLVVLLYRIGNFFYRKKVGFIGKFFWVLNRILFAVDINEKADLAAPFIVVHGIGIVIGAKVKSEGMLKVYQGVTIGGSSNQVSTYKGSKIEMPVLKDGVTCYPGSKILGAIVVGKDTVVGANSILTESCPNNSIVLGTKIKDKNENSNTIS